MPFVDAVARLAPELRFVAPIGLNLEVIELAHLKPSGIRIGTPTVATRRMKEPQMIRIAGWIDQVLSHPTDEAVRERVLGEVLELTDQFPFYREH